MNTNTRQLAPGLTVSRRPNWFQRLRAWWSKRNEPPVELTGHHGLRRQYRGTVETPGGDWRWVGSGATFKCYRYWCPCGTELTPGPRGGAAVNVVCEKCKINYGCLPGFEELE